MNLLVALKRRFLPCGPCAHGRSTAGIVNALTIGARKVRRRIVTPLTIRHLTIGPRAGSTRQGRADSSDVWVDGETDSLLRACAR